MTGRRGASRQFHHPIESSEVQVQVQVLSFVERKSKTEILQHHHHHHHRFHVFIITLYCCRTTSLFRALASLQLSVTAGNVSADDSMNQSLSVREKAWDPCLLVNKDLTSEYGRHCRLLYLTVSGEQTTMSNIALSISIMKDQRTQWQ